MLTGGPKDYRIAQHHQNEIRHEVEEWHRLQRATPFRPSRKRRTVVVVVALLALLAAYRGVYAQDAIASGGANPYHAGLLAKRLASDWSVTGASEPVVEKLTEVVALLPEDVVGAEPAYATMNWTVGETFEEAGRARDARYFYWPYLMVAGIGAAAWATAKVKTLTMRLTPPYAADRRVERRRGLPAALGYKSRTGRGSAC
jgi:hypothetical protein